MIARRTFTLGLGGLTVASAAYGGDVLRPGRQAVAWPGGCRAAISLTYDDGLDSQIDHAIAQLQARGFKATFFLTRDNVNARLKDWVDVAKLGHEVGNHSVTHQCDLRRYTRETFAEKEVRPMEDYLDAHFGRKRSRLYAYPCSVTNLGPGSPNQQLERYSAMLRTMGIRAARNCDGTPPSSIQQARRRPYDLSASAVTYDHDDPELAISYMQDAIRQGGWAVLVFHDILPARVADGDTSMASHGEILNWIASRPLWCAPMGEVLAHVMGAG